MDTLDIYTAFVFYALSMVLVFRVSKRWGFVGGLIRSRRLLIQSGAAWNLRHINDVDIKDELFRLVLDELRDEAMSVERGESSTEISMTDAMAFDITKRGG